MTRTPGEIVDELDLPIEYRYAALLEGRGAPAEEPHAEGSPVLRQAIEMFEQDFILKAHARCRWNRNEAAARLAIHKATLFRKLNRDGLYGTAVAPVRWQRGEREGRARQGIPEE